MNTEGSDLETSREIPFHSAQREAFVESHPCAQNTERARVGHPPEIGMTHQRGYRHPTMH